MITLTCTKCRATLTIDDAFAGGVCRCQHCGTIQTVPRLRDAGAPSSGAVAQAVHGSARTLYQGKRSTAQAPTGSGLDELGEIIASSGLSSSRLRQPPSRPGAAARPERARIKVSPVLAGGLAAALVVLLAVALLLLRPDAETAGERSALSGPTSSEPVVAAPTGPHFVGMPLEGQTVIYVLDRGSATADAFGYLKDATFRSLETLGSDRAFQIIFWDNGSVAAYPLTAPLPATPSNIAAARKRLVEVYPGGHTEAQPALAQAMRAKPTDIIIGTAKGWDLDETFVQMIRNVTAGSSVRIHTVAIGGKDVAGPLEAVAREFGGQFRAVTTPELRIAAR